jgi:hypothetical protein
MTNEERQKKKQSEEYKAAFAQESLNLIREDFIENGVPSACGTKRIHLERFSGLGGFCEGFDVAFKKEVLVHHPEIRALVGALHTWLSWYGEDYGEKCITGVSGDQGPKDVIAGREALKPWRDVMEVKAFE